MSSIDQKEMSDKLIKYHSQYERDQIELESSFSYDLLNSIEINIDDDFHSDGYVPDGEIQETHASICTNDIPDIESLKILEVLKSHIVKEKLISNSTSMRLYFYDATNVFPGLINEHEYILNKKWKLMFTNITHKDLDELLNSLSRFKEINGVKVNFFSES
jgi:hypothetical protein